MGQYILAIDQGTTGSTALLFNADLQIMGKENVEFPQHFPQPGWVEHDLNQIWNSVCQAVEKVMERSRISASDIAAIGITNQRETTCLWRKEPNAPQVHRAIVWQDRRTAKQCQVLKKRGLEKKINKKTGLRLDPYFSATKLQWMLKNVPGAMAQAKAGKLAFGTIDSYLCYRIAGVHVTDVTNASRTMLMDLKKQEWDSELVRLFNVPKPLLPEILPSSVVYGKTKSFLNFPDGIPISGIAGDQQAALFGQACFSRGAGKCTYGTGAFALVNTGKEPIYSKSKLITTVAWKFGNQVTYGLEGSAFIAGAAVQWLRDGMGLIDNSADIEQLARSVDSSDGVVFVPALTGLGAPYWEPHATGLISGLNRGTTRAHLARATLEGLGFQVYELLECMNRDMGRKIKPLKVDGGASANNLLMQFQADLLGSTVIRSKIMETTALGSGLQAGLAIGFWSDLKEIEKKWKAAESFKPTMSAIEKKAHLDRWVKAIKATQLIAKGNG